MTKDMTRDQLVMLTASLRSVFNCDPVEDPEGRSEGHMAWMLKQVRSGLEDGTWDLGKANRWIGYVQAWLVIHYRARLDYIKQGVRYYKDWSPS